MVLPIILDWISADLILSCDKEVGNDLLAHYTSCRLNSAAHEGRPCTHPRKTPVTSCEGSNGSYVAEKGSLNGKNLVKAPGKYIITSRSAEQGGPYENRVE